MPERRSSPNGPRSIASVAALFSTLLLAPLLAPPSAATAAAADKSAKKPKPTATPSAAATPKPKPAGRARDVVVKSVEPTMVRAGDTVTIVGSGLDQVAAVILGSITPEIVEQTEGKLVFRVLLDRKKPESYRAEPYLVIPGRSVRPVNATVEVLPVALPGRTPMPADRRGVKTVLDETVPLAAGASKTIPFEFGDAVGLRVLVTAGGGGGGEVETSVAVERGGEALYRLTYGGKLDWRIRRNQLLGRAKDADGPRPGTLTLRSDATEPLTVKLVVETLN